MWDLTRYNVLVQQVEGCSDILDRVLERIQQTAGADLVALELTRHIEQAVDELDLHALRMLACYDPSAVSQLRLGLRRDRRRRPGHSERRTKTKPLLRLTTDSTTPYVPMTKDELRIASLALRTLMPSRSAKGRRQRGLHMPEIEKQRKVMLKLAQTMETLLKRLNMPTPPALS